jgi:hypothetical protein
MKEGTRCQQHDRQALAKPSMTYGDLPWPCTAQHIGLVPLNTSAYVVLEALETC